MAAKLLTSFVRQRRLKQQSGNCGKFVRNNHHFLEQNENPIGSSAIESKAWAILAEKQNAVLNCY